MINSNLSTPYSISNNFPSANYSIIRTSAEEEFVNKHSNIDSSHSFKTVLNQHLQQPLIVRESLPFKKRKIQSIQNHHVESTNENTPLKKRKIDYPIEQNLRVESLSEPSQVLEIYEVNTLLNSTNIQSSTNDSKTFSFTSQSPSTSTNNLVLLKNRTEPIENPVLLKPIIEHIEKPIQPLINSIHIEPQIAGLPRHLHFLEQQNQNASVRFIIVQKKIDPLFKKKKDALFEIDRMEYKTKHTYNISLQLYQMRIYHIFIQISNDKIKNIKLSLVKFNTAKINEIIENYLILDNENKNTFDFRIDPKSELNNKNKTKNLAFKLKLEIETNDATQIEEYSAPFSFRKQLNTGRAKSSTILGLPILAKVESYEDVHALI